MDEKAPAVGPSTPVAFQM